MREHFNDWLNPQYKMYYVVVMTERDFHGIKLSYRPDIDGLRAIAVLAVVANHLPEEFLPSGFLGVDVFFVISGFVVSASIWGQNRSTFSSFYSNFLARRIKRLMPALITCVAITGVIVFMVDPIPKNSILTGISALFGLANITLFNFELDYFSPSSKFNTFTHTWSLGVEEQFYVVFPLIIWLTFFGRSFRHPRIFTTFLALMSLLSLAFFLWLYDVNRVVAYYLLPTRFWELGVGVLVYVASTTFAAARFSRVLASTFTIALAALLLCFIIPKDYAIWSTPLVVCLTGLLLLNPGQSLSWRMLSLPPLVYVGKISYSLYLWHWPVVSLGPLVLRPSWRISALYVAIIGLAAISSYRFIEQPLRVANWSRSRARDIAMGLACSTLLGISMLLALLIKETYLKQDVVAHHPPAFLPILYSGLPYEACVVDELRPMTSQTFEQCTFPSRKGSGMPMIWTMGNSHAGHLQGMLYELHHTMGFGVHLIETPGHLFPDISGREYPPRQVLFEKALEKLKPGDIVVVSRLYLERTNPTKPRQDISIWMDRVSSLAKLLKSKEATLVVAGPPPIFHFTDVRECDIAEREYCAVARAEIASPIDSVMSSLVQLQDENLNVLIFDIFEEVCPSAEEFCYPDDGNIFLFRDQDHFNSLGSKRLAKAFANFLRESGIMLN